MKSTILGLLAVGLLAGPMAALALPITYLYSGTGTGTLNGNAFAADFVVTAQADTKNIGPWCCSDRQNIHSSASITISGVGTFDFLITTYSWISDSFNEGGFNRDLSANLLTLLEGMGGYDLASPFGPVSDTTGSTQGQFNDISTSGGLLTISALRNGLTFEAQVAEPGTFALLGLGLAGLGLSRRRKTAERQ